MKLAEYVFVIVCAGLASAAGAQSWTPQKNVELVVPNPPGGSNDKTARTVERILKANNLVSSTMTVVNKPGGGGSIAYTYVQQHAGDPHFLVVAGPAILTNHITGASKLRHSDLMPIAALFDDYTAFVVAAGSSLKSGKELTERLKKDPKSVTIGFSPLLGSHNHIAAGLLMKAIGGNARDLKVVAYKGSADAIPNLMGGHIDLVTTAVGNVAGHGKLAIVAVTATQRFGGPLANVPTWKEQGIWCVARNLCAEGHIARAGGLLGRRAAQGDRSAGVEAGSRTQLLGERVHRGRRVREGTRARLCFDESGAERHRAREVKQLRLASRRRRQWAR